MTADRRGGKAKTEKTPDERKSDRDMNEVKKKTFQPFLLELKKSNYIFRYYMYHATFSAQRRRSQICVNEPRQSSWSIFDASSDPSPPSPPPLESSRESTNFLRDHFSFALNFLFARLWKSESLKGVKSDQEWGTGDCHDAAAAA